LPASGDPQALQTAIQAEVRELEELCKRLEQHLVRGDWKAASEAVSDSRRVTHAFLNAMEEAGDARNQEFDAAIYARMRRVFDVRQDQLARLETFRDDVGERLQAISRWKQFGRSIGAKRASKRGAGLDSSR
jgi:pyrroloquinoline quinone (PQQ) biosynthesis protein C